MKYVILRISSLSPANKRSIELTSKHHDDDDRRRTAAELYTILEESETVKSESTHSTLPQPRLSRSSADYNNNEDREMKPISSTTTTTMDTNHSIEQNEKEHQEHASSSPPSSSVESSYEPSSLFLSSKQQKSDASRFPPELVGDEDQCRHKFAKMVKSAYRRQLERQKEYSGTSNIPRDIEILFDDKSNIEWIRFSIRGDTEQHRFCGNAQFIPPEMSIAHGPPSQQSLVDVWILGVSLYRMLVGKFPFNAANDRQMFKKMLHAGFSVPPELSSDVKDLLRRMLAPDTTRASLDLVLYHPWLKPCKIDVSTMAQAHDNNTMVISNTPPVSPAQESNPPTATIASKRQSHQTTESSKRNSLTRALRQAFMVLVEGPYPPPKRPYQDLTNNPISQQPAIQV
ncbi:predicted protein [Lichtheimia corymbifera JMRC:FSU:9682]|uniref:Protein kinase domain-containing protein n=1 Tax=Lichtheimia corymbifera JMRC:FSU:9682 TaxID=1263082 RepID=A0A068RQ44_9FUNG|nr:predicted protein [Lichtheimia corymbifera JMRC:FSU:9682]